jgi:hypothetical protein
MATSPRRQYIVVEPFETKGPSASLTAGQVVPDIFQDDFLLIMETLGKIKVVETPTPAPATKTESAPVKDATETAPAESAPAVAETAPAKPARGAKNAKN